jgi:tRNA pseudouridine55 synthase
LQKAKWLLRAEKAGHTGTLDPLATGVLPLCFGAATKFSQLQLEADKTYAPLPAWARPRPRRCRGRGARERWIWRHHARAPGAVQAQFTGDIQQVPPMHSALKKDGKACTNTPARASRWSARRAMSPFMHWNCCAGERRIQLSNGVTCSKGTYIRTLAEDIGEALGCGAHLRAAPHRHRRLGRTLRHAAGAGGHAEASACAVLPATRCCISRHAGREDAGRFLSGLRRRPWPDAGRGGVW